MHPRWEIGSDIFSYRGQFLLCDANIRRAAQSACAVCAVISIFLADFDQQKAFYVNFVSTLTMQLLCPKRSENLTVSIAAGQNWKVHVMSAFPPINGLMHCNKTRDAIRSGRLATSKVAILP